MGILKHVVLPIYAGLAFLISLGTWLSGDMSEMEEAWADEDRNFKDQPMTKLELHLMDAVCGACLLLGLNSVVAIFWENSHYRGMAVVLVMIFFGVDGYSYSRLGKSIPGIIVGILTLGAFGLAVHAMEPGVFTKDKNASVSQKTKAK